VGSVGPTSITVLFLATLEGVIHKMAVFPVANGADDDETGSTLVCLVEAIHLSERPKPRLIRSLQLHTVKVEYTQLNCYFVPHPIGRVSYITIYLCYFCFR